MLKRGAKSKTGPRASKLTQSTIKKYLKQGRAVSVGDTQSQTQTQETPRSEDGSQAETLPAAGDFTHRSADNRWVCGGKDLKQSATYTGQFAKAVYEAWDKCAAPKRQHMKDESLKSFRPHASVYTDLFIGVGLQHCARGL